MALRFVDEYSIHWTTKAISYDTTSLIGKTGFEPAAPWSQTRCSAKLSYFPFTYNCNKKFFEYILNIYDSKFKVENIDLFKSVDDEWEEIANADTSFDDDDLLLDN